MPATTAPRRAGFSLMELLAVVTILGILAAIILPRVTSSAGTAKDRTCVFNCGQIHSAVEQYRHATGVWPSADLRELDGNLDYFPDGIPVCPVSEGSYTLGTAGELYRVSGHSTGAHAP